MNRTIATTLVLTLGAGLANAHDGRRYEVLLVDNQLHARGYNSAGVDDGAGVTRPYYNAMHDHWSFLGAGLGATSDLPGFDLLDPGAMAGHALTIELVGASKWENPPHMPAPGTVPTLSPLEAGEEIFVSFGLETVSTDAPGSFELASGIGAGGVTDLDLVYDILIEPSEVIFVLEFELSTDAPGVAPSSSVYVLLSPDGATPEEKLHHASLHLEGYLGTPVCAADFARPADGVANFTDVLAFLTAFGEGDGSADLAEPFGSIDFTDVLAFLSVFGAGCP
ncbi:MAG: GC-type dockerin domain-anchored protein [Phycisphaerales bacterium JB059]